MVSILLAAVIAAGAAQPVDSRALAPAAAKKTIAWAETLSERGIRISGADLDWLYDHVKSFDCSIEPTTRRTWNADQRDIADSFVENVCKASKKWPLAIVNECNPGNAPAWCDDPAEVYRQVNIDGYLSTLIQALQDSDDPLERFNLMLGLISMATAHFITEFPQDSIEPWYVMGTREYLKSAIPSDAAVAAEWLSDSWIGLFPELQAQFREFAIAHETVAPADSRRILNLVEATSN